jgi:hypothetical protein
MHGHARLCAVCWALPSPSSPIPTSEQSCHMHGRAPRVGSGLEVQGVSRDRAVPHRSARLRAARGEGQRQACLHRQQRQARHAREEVRRVAEALVLRGGRVVERSGAGRGPGRGAWEGSAPHVQRRGAGQRRLAVSACGASAPGCSRTRAAPGSGMELGATRQTCMSSDIMPPCAPRAKKMNMPAASCEGCGRPGPGLGAHWRVAAWTE